MNYYRRYVGDYLRDTSRLSMLEHGAYNLMLDYYYADEKPLPLDKDELYTMVRAMRPEDKRAVDKILGLYFTRGADGYHQGRVDEELGVARATIAKQRESGAEAAAKRWGGGSTDRSTHNDGDGSTDGPTHRSTDTSGDGLQHTRDPSSTDTTSNQNKPPTTQPPAASARGTRLPADWRLTTEQIEWAIGAQPTWDAEHALKVAESFRDHWRSVAGQRGVKLDWDATWRNWVRREGPNVHADRRVADKFAGAI
jgi:uncharacterized protein YdaU (DUF1376 family)